MFPIRPSREHLDRESASREDPSQRAADPSVAWRDQASVDVVAFSLAYASGRPVELSTVDLARQLVALAPVGELIDAVAELDLAGVPLAAFVRGLAAPTWGRDSFRRASQGRCRRWLPNVGAAPRCAARCRDCSGRPVTHPAPAMLCGYFPQKPCAGLAIPTATSLTMSNSSESSWTGAMV
jgi:hypothetical protein